jgi:hypothetical protein
VFCFKEISFVTKVTIILWEGLAIFGYTPNMNYKSFNRLSIFLAITLTKKTQYKNLAI